MHMQSAYTNVNIIVNECELLLCLRLTVTMAQLGYTLPLGLFYSVIQRYFSLFNVCIAATLVEIIREI